MSNELVESKSFNEKMRDRIKESIGDLLSDEDLTKIVDEGIRMVFFQPYNTIDKWGAKVEHLPLIVTVVKELLTSRVNEKADQWFAENPDKVSEILDQVIRDGIVKMVMSSFEEKTQSALIGLKQHIMSMIQR